MGIPDGAHTHGSGSGLGTAVLVLASAALAVKLAGPVLDAVGELVHVFLLVAAGIVAVGAAGLVGLLAWRWRRWQKDAARAKPPTIVARAAQSTPQPRPAIERAPEVHLHLHGVTAEDIAAIIRQQEDN